MTPRADVKDRLDRAVRYICKQQNPNGGWGEQHSDLAITGAMYMTLRSARSAGIMSPTQPFEKFEKFIRKCQNSDGGFRQFPDQPSGSMFYPTTAGLRVLYGLGKGKTPEVQCATRFMINRQMGQDYGGRISEWCYCGAFYAAGALLIDEDEAWQKWFPRIRDYLCKIQNADGSWTIEYCSHCKAYATALALCTLQAPYRILPIYQL
jgi:prenyltransferase beta subunit